MSGCVVSTEMYQLRRQTIARAFDLLKGAPAMDREGNLVLVDGQPFMLPPTAAMLNTVRQLLKDNGVDHDPIEVLPGNRALTSLIPLNEEEPTLLE